MSAIAPIAGLVLAGGRSSRMGEDKALIDYHGRPQYQHVFELLSAAMPSVFISCRPAQQELFQSLPVITDELEDIGPMAALLAAFTHNPATAWLVLGCDYPNFGEAQVRKLLQHRNPDAFATAFFNAERQWPEPLLAIWEPVAHGALKAAHANGQHSLRRLLEAQNSVYLEPKQSASIASFDSPQSRDNFHRQ